ncbi:unnamed protein product [Pedinophyceae sp. YPF-701]|nr:unnamed protein product [Pedinophyceae sp. YPF-701]
MAHLDDPEFEHGAFDALVEGFATYEDYLDSQITATDLFYLDDVELARQLVELGYRGNGEVLSREEFVSRKEAAELAKKERYSRRPRILVSAGKDVEHSPLLKALSVREEAVLNGKLATIIFVRDRNSRGQEVSGYIDFGHRLRTENLEPVFLGRRRLMPKASDLSYYNWETKMSAFNHTPNFLVIADPELGLLFKNKRDRKVINVDPRSTPGDNSCRVELEGGEYTQVVIYDHITRRRG